MVVIQCIANEKEESRQRAIPLFVATDNQIVSFKSFLCAKDIIWTRYFT